MTVSELINMLQEFDEDAVVNVADIGYRTRYGYSIDYIDAVDADSVWIYMGGQINEKPPTF